MIWNPAMLPGNLVIAITESRMHLVEFAFYSHKM